MRELRIGIDEVGRGALAGPVVLAAVRAERMVRWTHHSLGRIRDSKRLTPNRREAWFQYLTAHPALSWRVTTVSPAVIDRINIARASNLGALRLARMLALPGRSFRVFLDGGLVLPPNIPHETIIHGDARIPLIAAASIIAKVTRDRLMVRLGRRLPDYGFSLHKGYGTQLHRARIRCHGPSPFHRRTFLGKVL